MPWRQAQSVQIETAAPHSFLPNNLAADGDSRAAFIHGKRIQCIKRLGNTQGHSHFALAYSEKMDVTSLFWWTGLKRYSRPLLVFTTESSPKISATLQIWNVSRGTGSRVFRCELDELENDQGTPGRPSRASPIQFGRGLAQASSSTSGQLLFCGASNGSVFGIALKEGRDEGFRKACTIRNFSHALVTLAGDKKQSDFLAASDEAGNMAVWSIEEELDRDATNPDDYRCEEIYRYVVEDDFCCALGLKGSVVIAGHVSGYLTFHDVDHKLMFASVVSNTKAITSIDTNAQKDLVLVCGEDCRVSVLGFSERRTCKPVVYFSVALDSIITGCAILTSQRGYPRLAILTWEKCEIVQYQYEKSGQRGRKRQEGAERGVTGCVTDGTSRYGEGLFGAPSQFLKQSRARLLSPSFAGLMRPGGNGSQALEGAGSYIADDFSVQWQSPPKR